MKVYIGPYKYWVGPYQIAEKILFWLDRYEDDRVQKLGRWLAGGEDGGSWLARLCRWIDSKRNRKIKIRIDRYDTWNMDDTLALIILPMLKQLQKEKHGAPWVDDKDVPKELRRSSAPPVENDWDVDDNFFKRWDWVMGEMIAAFEIHLEQDFMTQDEELFKRRNRGFRLFGKYYVNLWD